MQQNNELQNISAKVMRDKYKKKPSRRSLSFVITSTKTEDFALSDSITPENYQTNLERIFLSLNKIKQKLSLIKEDELVEQVNWMTERLLGNQLNDIIIKIENENNNNKEELKRLLELLAEFSSEFNFRRKIESLQSVIMLKKEKLNETKLNETNINKPFDIKNEIMQQDFNIFSFLNEVGRPNLLHIVSGNILNNFGLFNKVNQNTFSNFIDEIKEGYKQENPYHNVKFRQINN